MSESKFDAIVAGCGPVGAVAANLLGRRAINTLVIEQDHEPYLLPRAIHFDAEVMRVLQSAGLAERILPHLFTPRASVHFGADGGIIRVLSMRGSTGRHGWTSNYMFYQPELEAALRDSLGRWPHVRMQFGAAVVGVSQDADGVEVTVRRQDGTTDSYRSRYLLACDGASSSVRKQLDIALEDLQFEEPWLVIDADVDGALSLPDTFQAGDLDLQQTSVMICDPRRPSTVIPGRGRHRRWEFMLLPRETDEHMLRASTIQGLLGPWVVNAKCKVIRAAVYRFHGLLARRWQTGRVFLLGDAAHQTPPFYGQGFCHGVRDSANLAWKLELVLRSQAAPAVLDSYEPERLPQVRHAVEASVAAGRYICTLDPVRARERDERMRMALRSATTEMFFQVAPLTGGVIALHQGVPGKHGVGTQFIQPRVRMPDGRELLLDDAIGHGFALLTSRADPLSGLAPDMLEFWKRLGGITVHVTDAVEPAPPGAMLCIADESGEIGAWLKQHDVEAVIVRPDAYVFAAVPRLEMLAAALQRLRSALHWSGAGATRPAQHEEVAC